MIKTIKENKIILTSKPFDIMKKATKEHAITLTPLTPISKIINFTKKGLLNTLFQNEGLHEASLLSENNISNFKDSINKNLGFDYLDYGIDLEKITKIIFELNNEITIDQNNIEKILKIIDDLAEDKIIICLFGFNEIKLPIYKSIVVINLVQTLTTKIINWENLEDLIIWKDDDWFEVHDKEKLLSWLEMKTRTVLRLSDLDDFFQGKMNMNTFLIERAFRAI